MDKFEIDIDQELDRFGEHIKPDYNNHIILSGIFGIGKTYFIKKFFEVNPEHELIYLTPVNYVVSQNEDIFEYIKYDILFELFRKDLDFEKLEFSRLLTSQMFILNKPMEIIRTLLSSASKLDKTVDIILNPLLKLYKNYEEYHSKLQKDEISEIESFFKKIEIDNGPYKIDHISKIITHTIEAIANTGKKVILVVDDMDRIDPEHIFRLFNVFACHLDCNPGSKNKFGLDKIIFVCDIENIRNIFHAKYGANVDFTGYIDKFYSQDVFHFDIRNSIEQSITKIFSTISITNPGYGKIFNPKDKDLGLTKTLTDILGYMVYVKAINLRAFVKLINKPRTMDSYGILFYDRFVPTKSYCLGIALVFDFLRWVFGTDKNLETALIKCEELNLKMVESSTNMFWSIGFMLTVLDYEKHNFQDGIYNYDNKDLNISIEYEIKHYGDWHDQISGISKKITSYLNHEGEIKIIPYFSLLRLAYEKMKRYKKTFN